MNKVSRKLFLTLFYSGLSPKAPGTVGSIVALFLGIIVLMLSNQLTLLLGTVLISIMAIKQIDIYEKEMNEHDSKEIVIDELVGMWIAMYIAGVTIDSYLLMFLAFLFFRFFDIFKPWVIGQVDQKVNGGLGVMGDDILAGFAGGICALLVYTLILVVK